MNSGALLLTGVPGVGKTTVLRRVKDRLAGRQLRGFLTDEIRSSRGDRLGFRIETLDGRTARLAGVGLRSTDRVGRYGVDVGALDAVAVPALALEEGPSTSSTRSARWSAFRARSAMRSRGCSTRPALSSRPWLNAAPVSSLR